MIRMIDRRYLAGFAAGALVGVALGVPSGYALLVVGDHSDVPRAGVSVPARALPSVQSSVASLIEEGRHARRNGQPEQALAAALQAERLSPNDANIKNNVCAYLGELRRYDQAIVACSAALRLQPDLQLARNNLNWVQAERVRAGAPSAP
jgi:tetratricopeptide (TPR) repeat protein